MSEVGTGCFDGWINHRSPVRFLFWGREERQIDQVAHVEKAFFCLADIWLGFRIVSTPRATFFSLRQEGTAELNN